MALGEGGVKQRENMEYTDYCPNCMAQLIVEEFPGNVAIKYRGTAIGSHCPNCKAHLGVDQDGLYLIKTRDESDLLDDEE